MISAEGEEVPMKKKINPNTANVSTFISLYYRNSLSVSYIWAWAQFTIFIVFGNDLRSVWILMPSHNLKAGNDIIIVCH